MQERLAAATRCFIVVKDKLTFLRSNFAASCFAPGLSNHQVFIMFVMDLDDKGPLLKRITVSPDVIPDTPVIRGMPITVESILKGLASGRTPEDIVQDTPSLELEDIRACIVYAYAVVANDDGVHKLIANQPEAKSAQPA